ncbi:MAG: lysyl oxidase family protein [Chloroflexota bacterium]
MKWRFLSLLLGSLLILLACTQAEPAEESATPSSLSSAAPALTEAEATNDDISEETATAENTAVSPSETPTSSKEVPPPVVETAVSEEPEPPATATAVPTAEPTTIPSIDPSEFGDGALIQIEMNGTAGVLLDGIPVNLQEDVIEHIFNQDEAYWDALARRHVNLTKYRLNFRNFKLPGKGQLPLPPESLWQIELDEAGPRQVLIQDHSLIVIDYTFTSTLLTDPASTAEAEPALAEIGGIWNELFILPLDPDFIVQRTGKACVNEAGFPPNSYDTETVRDVYDFSCVPSSVGKVGCHRNEVPSLTCLEAVDAFVGRFETFMRFERVPWDDELADSVRIGPVTSLEAPDFQVVTSDLLDYRIVYEYFEEGDCALEEDAVGDTGWRRLLRFSATMHNVGAEPLHIGFVVSEDPQTNIFEYNPCHDHFHFSNYGNFIFDGGSGANGSKRAFCVESTNRFSNNETSPLTHPYSCTFQGIQAGWVDEYKVGLDVQWIDITDVEFDEPLNETTIGFSANEDSFLCEGTAVLNPDGSPVYEPSGLRTPSGLPISRPQCDFIDNWDANNAGFETLMIPDVGSFVTADCDEDQFGHLRNCGFEQFEEPIMCTPGETITVSLELDEPHVLRACEVSSELGVGLACTTDDAISNVIMGLRETSTVQFVCPRVRDYDPDPDDEDAPLVLGGYALYLAPYFE